MNAHVCQNIKTVKRYLLSGNKPDFIIIGAQKAGTTSLHYYLDQHPELFGSKPKEVYYFNRDIHFGKSLKWYESHFTSIPSLNKKKKYFESTPAYMYHPGTAERIKEAYPYIKLIVVLRDPIKRAFSAWNHYRDLFESGTYKQTWDWQDDNPIFKYFFNNRSEFPTFRECIDIELDLIAENTDFEPAILDNDMHFDEFQKCEPAILRRGLYLEQLEKYYSLFGESNLLVLGFKDLITDTENTLTKITDFVGAKKITWDSLQKEVKNSFKYPVSMNDSDKAFLEDFYREPNEKLFNKIGEINW